MDGPARPGLAASLRLAMEKHQIVSLAGAAGLGQMASIRLAIDDLLGWEAVYADGCWLRSGYLCGFHGLVMQLLEWAQASDADLLERHEQTLKRLLPKRACTAYRVPKDLTNSAQRDERTRFYHHEYQNKLLVGLAEFLLEALRATGRKVVLVVDNAGRLSPTSKSLVDIVSRKSGSAEQLRFVLLDRSRTVFNPRALVIEASAYTQQDFYKYLDLENRPSAFAQQIYTLSGGNLHVGRALCTCAASGITPVCNLSAQAIIDLHLASLSASEREAMAVGYLRSTMAENPIAQRNLQTVRRALIDAEHVQLHQAALQKYIDGNGPLVLAHAMAITDKFQRVEAVTAPCEALMEIGLYDTWFEVFAPMFADPDLRAYGDGDSAVNGLFINAAFVLYAMGHAAASMPYLDEFLQRFPRSHFVPTALYAQSMTYGRYRIPVDLPVAEQYATQNLQLIDSQFKHHPRYQYIKVFAENAYAYIKARQGKFGEALELCNNGNSAVLASYGEESYKLHRSILIYNTSQVYEIVGDLPMAEEKLKEAIACDPYYAEYYNDLGNLLSRTEGREQEALDAYASAIRLSPPYYEAHLNRGVLRLQVGDAQGALQDFSRTLEIKPQEWRAFKEIGNTRLQQGNIPAALDAYLHALQLETRDPDLHANIGLAYSESGDSTQAVQHYKAAISIQPNHAESHNNLAAELVGMGQYAEALDHATAASKIGKTPEFAANKAAIEALCGKRRDGG